MKRINNEQILDTIYDIADSLGMRIDEFILKIQNEFGEALPDLENIPEEIANELISARETKKAHRLDERLKREESDRLTEIKSFREIFPDVAPEDIPESVWEDCREGSDLTHAYALYLITEEILNSRASEINRRNGKFTAKASSDGATEPSFTKDQVERMSGKDVKSNYKNIIKAMKGWRF